MSEASTNTALSIESVEVLRELAPKPKNINETGLSKQFLSELLSKHLYEAGALTISQLVKRMKLAGSIIEDLLSYLRQEARLEVLPKLGFGQELHYSLTDLGRVAGFDALSKSGYIGPAPIPLEQYQAVVQAQSVHLMQISQSNTHQAFRDVVIKESLLDQLGPALNSGRSIIIYGPSGTGKTYISQRLTRLLTDSCLIPHAIAINENVVQLFDPQVHKTINQDNNNSGNLLFASGYDTRFNLCQRPVVISGGELTLEMLEVQYDNASKLFRAPLQMKANNGMFIIDDMGRQRVTPAELFNRWIVPMEEKRDHLHLRSGQNFEVPFDEILVFSTNINPLELGDMAFIRRIGHKIFFDTLDREEFTKIWAQVCEEKQITCDPELLGYLFNNHFQREHRSMLPCHPRDLLGIAQDKAMYLGTPTVLTKELLDWAWDSYFVKLEQQEGQPILNG
jgi:hypothetical protein